jgi:hypothetical protein
MITVLVLNSYIEIIKTQGKREYICGSLTERLP